MSQVRSFKTNRKEFLKTKENNLENVRDMNKIHVTDHELLLPARNKQNFTVADGTHEMNMANVI